MVNTPEVYISLQIMFQKKNIGYFFFFPKPSLGAHTIDGLSFHLRIPLTLFNGIFTGVTNSIYKSSIDNTIFNEPSGPILQLNGCQIGPEGSLKMVYELNDEQNFW